MLRPGWAGLRSGHSNGKVFLGSWLIKILETQFEEKEGLTSTLGWETVLELKRVIFMNGEMFFISSKKSNQQEKNLKQVKKYLATK